MSGFIKGEDRTQATLFPERPDDYASGDSAVRIVDVFIDELDLSGLLELHQRPAKSRAAIIQTFNQA